VNIVGVREQPKQDVLLLLVGEIDEESIEDIEYLFG
jgi:hypothetical protein